MENIFILAAVMIVLSAVVSYTPGILLVFSRSSISYYCLSDSLPGYSYCVNEIGM